MWSGPFKVVSVQHPRLGLENAPGRRSRNQVHFKRLHKYLGRDEEYPITKKRIDELIQTDYLNTRMTKKDSYIENELQDLRKYKKKFRSRTMCVKSLSQLRTRIQLSLFRKPKAESMSEKLFRVPGWPKKARLSLHRWLTAGGDQPMRTSSTKIRKSKNISSVPAVQVHPRGRLKNCNTMYYS